MLWRNVVGCARWIALFGGMQSSSVQHTVCVCVCMSMCVCGYVCNVRMHIHGCGYGWLYVEQSLDSKHHCVCVYVGMCVYVMTCVMCVYTDMVAAKDCSIWWMQSLGVCACM